MFLESLQKIHVKVTLYLIYSLYRHDTLCGGCGGRIVSSEESSYCDTFVFICKHAFHIECLVDDNKTKCALCNSNKK